MAERDATEDRDQKGRFLTGNNGGGRQKGSRNKLSERYTVDLLAEWENRGAEALSELSPVELVRAVGAVLPKEMNVKVGELDDLTDEQLLTQLAAVRAELARAGIAVAAGNPAQDEAEPAGGVSSVH